MAVTKTSLAIAFKFLTDAGKEFTLSMKNADPQLKADELLDTKIDTAMDAIIALQPFGVTLSTKHGWSLTSTEKIIPD